jgi:hypothetical protein
METQIRTVKTPPAKLEYIYRYQSIKYKTDPEFREKRCVTSAKSTRNRYQNDPEYRAKKQEANRIYQTALRAKKKNDSLITNLTSEPF